MCTAMQLKYDQGSVLGRTMDIEAPVDYNIIYFPRDYPSAENLLGGHFPSQYKMMGIGFRDWDPLKDGVNEHGLMGVTNDYGGFNLHPDQVDPNKINVSSFYFMNYCLANFKTVDELIEHLPDIHLSTHNSQGEKVISPKFHFMFADASQRCVVIEPRDQQLLVYDNPYQVMTNTPKFPSHLKVIEDYFGELDDLNDFNAAKHLPGGYDPKSRFVKAYYFSQTSLKPEDNHQALGYLFRNLSAIALPQGFIKNQSYHSITFTQYIAGYDSSQQTLNIQAADNPTIYSLHFDDIAQPDQRQAFFIPHEFQGSKIAHINN